MIYLDHNATTPLAPGVLEAMLPWLAGGFGNASSVHSVGQKARQAVDDARESVASALGCSPKELVFTSGGTEADNLALRGLFAMRGRRRVVVSAVEHPAVLETARALAREGAEVVEVPVDRDGLVDLDRLGNTVDRDTALVSVMFANNETGVVSPIDRIGLLCRERGVPFHVDAVQAVGKVPIDLATLPCDALSLSAHKFGGPKGAGALFVRRGVSPWAAQTGGHQERGRRGGTENVAGIVGLGHAIALATRKLPEMQRIREMSRSLEAVLAAIDGTTIVGARGPRIGQTTTACFDGVEGEAVLMGLDLEGICASSGSACTAGSLEPSHVLLAMGFAPKQARGAVRFSIGPTNTHEELAAAAAATKRVVEALRRRTRRTTSSGGT